MRLILGALQMPATKHNGCIFTWQRKLQIGKGQGSHLFARVVVFLITIEDCLPAARYVIPGNKYRLIRTIVAIHVAFDVATIPGITLRIKDGANGGDCFCFLRFGWRLCLNHHSTHQEQDCSPKGFRAHVVSGVLKRKKRCEFVWRDEYKWTSWVQTSQLSGCKN